MTDPIAPVNDNGVKEITEQFGVDPLKSIGENVLKPPRAIETTFRSDVNQAIQNQFPSADELGEFLSNQRKFRCLHGVSEVNYCVHCD